MRGQPQANPGTTFQPFDYGTPPFSTHDFDHFDFRSPEDIFNEFMRQQCFGEAGSVGNTGEIGRSSLPVVTTVERPIFLTLEELYYGTTKKIKISRKSFNENYEYTTDEQILEVPVKPGLLKGSKIKFNGVGNQVEGGRQDLHFIVQEVLLLTLFPFLYLQSRP